MCFERHICLTVRYAYGNGIQWNEKSMYIRNAKQSLPILVVRYIDFSFHQIPLLYVLRTVRQMCLSKHMKKYLKFLFQYVSFQKHFSIDFYIKYSENDFHRHTVLSYDKYWQALLCITYVHICACVCVFICMYVLVCVCLYVCMCLCVCPLSICICIRVHVRVHVCPSLCLTSFFLIYSKQPSKASFFLNLIML